MLIKFRKKQFIVFFIIVILTGCAVDSSRQIIFKAEKSLHQAERLFNIASIKPDLADRYIWLNIKTAYLSTIAYCWTHLDSLPVEQYPAQRNDLESVAFMATSRLASIYYAESNFDSSVIVLSQLLELTKLSDRALLSSQSNLARAYQATGDWLSGIDIYKSIIGTFYPPVDAQNNILKEVLSLPIELLKIDLRLQNISNSFEKTEATRNYYQRLIAEWPNTELEREARRLLAGIMIDFSKWDEAIETISVIKDSSGLTDIPESMRIAEILSNGKNDESAAIVIYKELLDRVDDSALMADILIKIATAQYNNKAFTDCLETLKSLKKDYLESYMSTPMPQLYLARSYEKLDKWERAENEYKWLITNFPNSEYAFETFLTISRHYENSKNARLADSWYDKADEFYFKLQSQQRGNAIEASAISYRAEVARRRGSWDSAALRLEELFRRFPNKDVGRRGLTNAIDIYRNRLNNPAKADSLQALAGSGT